MAESPEPGQVVVPQSYRNAARRVIEVDDTATAVPKIVNIIFEGAIQARATDIHIEPQVPRMRVRYRIDGMLFDALTVPQPLQDVDHFAHQGAGGYEHHGAPLASRMDASLSVWTIKSTTCG